jgi:hypothetical protein
MSFKKPPDKYRTIKCSLKSILRNELNQPKLFDNCNRTHQLVIHTYHLLRLWVLNKYHNKQEIPLITDDTIKMAFKSLLQDSQRPHFLFLQSKNKKFLFIIYKKKRQCRQTTFSILTLVAV